MAPRLPSESTTDSAPMARICAAASSSVAAREQRAPQQALGLLLVGRDDSGLLLDALAQRLAIGMQQRFHVLPAGHGDQFAVERRRHARRQAAAHQQPGCLRQATRGPRAPRSVTSDFDSSGPVSFRFTVRPCRSVTVRLVRMGFWMGTSGDGVAASRQELFQPLAGIAARDQHRVGFAAEGVDHARRVDAAPARRFAAGVDVGAVFKGQAVDAEDPVDGRIDGEGDNQTIILAAIQALTARIASNAAPVRRPSTDANPAPRSRRW